jgi:hypothetical protein
MTAYRLPSQSLSGKLLCSSQACFGSLVIFEIERSDATGSYQVGGCRQILAQIPAVPLQLDRKNNGRYQNKRDERAPDDDGS